VQPEKETVVIVGTAHIVVQQAEAHVHGMVVLEIGHMNIGGIGKKHFFRNIKLYFLLLI